MISESQNVTQGEYKWYLGLVHQQPQSVGTHWDENFPKTLGMSTGSAEFCCSGKFRRGFGTQRGSFLGTVGEIAVSVGVCIALSYFHGAVGHRWCLLQVPGDKSFCPQYLLSGIHGLQWRCFLGLLGHVQGTLVLVILVPVPHSIWGRPS
jgi:hypothetical protein